MEIEMSEAIPNEHTGENPEDNGVSKGAIRNEDTAPNGNLLTTTTTITITTTDATPEPPVEILGVYTSIKRQRNKSVHQRYEDTVPKKHRNIIANLVSALMVLSLWVSFSIPSALLVYALADFFSDRLDPFSNDSVSSVYRGESCPGSPAIDFVVRELRRVANGEFNGTNFSCVATFVSNGTQCVPECLVWYPGGEVYFYLGIISVPILSFVTLIAATLGASTWLCLKSLWKFPHIISLYLILCVSVQALMIFIGSINRREFFCSSSSLSVSQRNPNIQCQIQGPIFHYFVLAFMCWYICDIFNIVYVLLFPLKATRFLKHSTKIHIAQSLISWGLPLLTVAIVLAATRRYQHYSFPILCFPNELGLLFTFYIPGVVFSLLSGTGLILLGLVLYKRQRKFGHSSTTNVYQSLLRQLIVYSVALSVLIFIILIQFTLTSYNYKITDVYETVYNYCITAFSLSPQCCYQTYAEYYTPFWNFLNEATFCLWGVVALSVVWVKEARQLWTNILTCSPCRHKYKQHRDNATEGNSK